MKKLIIFNMLILVMACDDCSKKTIIYKPLYMDTCDYDKWNNLEQHYLYFRDSLDNLRNERIFFVMDSAIKRSDSLKMVALKEISHFADSAYTEIAIKRKNYLHWKDSLTSELDSLRNTIFYDNILIKGDTLGNVDIMFDETGKPYIRYR